MGGIDRAGRIKRIALARGVALAALTLAITASSAHASHFRFGSIEWKPRPDISPTSVEITVEHAWRTDFFPPFIGTPPSVGDPSPVTTTFAFGDGSTTGLAGTIIAIGAADEYFLARHTLIHTYPSVDDAGSPWIAFIRDCCRLGTLENEPSAFFQLETEIDLGFANSSPVSAISPIIVMEANTFNSIQLPFTDVDGDDLACRLATTAESFIITQPGPPFGGATFALTITPDCRLEWDTTGLTAGQLWAAQVIVGESRGGNPEHGRIPLDFIIEIVAPVSTAPACEVPPTPTGTVFVTPGVPFSATVQGVDLDPGATLTLNTSGLPAGATASPGLPTSSGSPVSTSISWTAAVSDIGPHPVFFSVTDENGQTGFCSFILEVTGVCGDGEVNAPSEQCDTPDDGACPGQCQVDCTCPAVCGDSVVSPPETCDPPTVGIEICNNGLDDDFDGDIDCRDFDCAPTEPATCDANCMEAPPCQAIERDPAIVRFGKDVDDLDFFRLHGRFAPQTALVPELVGLSVSLSNVNGVIYSTTLAPGDLLPKGNSGKRYRFRDKEARNGRGIRTGLHTLTLRRRPFSGEEFITFKIKAYGDFSTATEAFMTTDVSVGPERAFLQAEWRQRPNGWILRLSDLK